VVSRRKKRIAPSQALKLSWSDAERCEDRQKRHRFLALEPVNGAGLVKSVATKKVLAVFASFLSQLM